MADKGECTKTVSHSKVKVQENGRKAIFKNPENQLFEVSRVDGCLIVEGPRSDYLVTKNGSGGNRDVSVLVELKGVDVERACTQLISSAENEILKDLLANKLGFLVVCSRYPRFDTFVAKAKTHCAKKYKAGFHIVSGHGEFDIDQVAAIDGHL